MGANATIEHVRVQRESGERVPHRVVRRVARAREPLSLGQRRARRAASRGSISRCGRPPTATELLARRARADRRAPARRHAHLHRSRAAARHEPATAQVHRRRRRACGLQRQGDGPPRRAADRFGAVEPQPAADGKAPSSTPCRSSRSSPTTSSARTARPSASSTARRSSTCAAGAFRKPRRAIC